MGEHHPESPHRMGAITDRLIASGLLSHLEQHEAPLATREQLRRVHSAAYVDHIFSVAPKEGRLHLDPDTVMNPGSLPAALRAAGAVVFATDLVLGGKVRNAFCRIRPPGHHALSDRAMGFCIFNNIAVGAAHAIHGHSLKRVAILDFDVHHGNGTEEIFTANPQVMLCSTFQHPFYPYQGADSGNDHIINVPLAAGTDGTGFRKAVTERWLPAVNRFKPEMIFISAGFDAHRDDPLAHLKLVEADYRWVTQQIMLLAEQHAKGRIVSALEGGYDLDALGRSVTEHIRVLSGLAEAA
jgi:acetoin utilization deacetylase AcuC-like enzyme